MGSPLSVPEFVALVQRLDQQVAALAEEEAINVVVNLLMLTVKRYDLYPIYVIDAVIDILDARMFFDASLAPGSRRVDN